MPAVEEEIEGESDPEAYGHVRNENAREEIRTARGEKYDGGPETRLRGEKAAGKEKEQEIQVLDIAEITARVNGL